MTLQNKHIVDFLHYYYSFSHPPEYAVLINGPWGVGKSWLVKNSLKASPDNPREHIFVSLYGVTCIKDIQDSFFEQIHPFLSSKKVKAAGQLIKGIAKATLKVDFDGDERNETSFKVSADGIDLPSYLTDIGSRVLVFDDLERCSMNISDVLGYINQFVEHAGYKVVIIANEKEITDPDNSFSKIKEKLIGSTFEVTPDADLALNTFINSIDGTDPIKIVFRNHFGNIKNIYECSNFKNLRSLKQGLWNFNRLYLALPEASLDKEELISNLIKLYLAFFFENRNPKEPISNTDTQLPVPLNRTKELLDASTYSHLRIKYPSINFGQIVFESNHWDEIISSNIVDKIKIKQSIENTRFFLDKKTKNWIKLWHFEDLSDDEFSAVLKDVSDEIKNKSINDAFVLSHIAALFFSFSKLGLIEECKFNLLIQFEFYIDHLFDHNLLPEVYDRHYFDINGGYYGLSYRSELADGYKALNDYFVRKFNESINKRKPKSALDLLDLLKSDTNQFISSLIISNNGNGEFANTEILNYIPAKDFAEAMINLPGREIYEVTCMLNERYSHVPSNSNLIPEITWITTVKDFLITIKVKGTLSGYKASYAVDIMEKIETRIGNV